ncbi:Intradiol ring-cleavage dioxygenase [Xylaria acuta]|nr:Intradiol ring-cleavage dioxygenase [Xylaria acuta]
MHVHAKTPNAHRERATRHVASPFTTVSKPGFSVVAIAGLFSTVSAHPENISRHEIQRLGDISKRCQPFAASLNWKRMAKRPIVTEGPYVWPRSQTLRQDMSEGQPLWMDIGIIDVNTCEPLPNILLNFWHCNATGSCSSVADLRTDGTTFLRGILPFPNFYVCLTIHIQVQAYKDWNFHNNGTLSSGNIVSIGQLYFGESLSEQLMALEPYASRTRINRAEGGYDPTFSVVAADGEDYANGVIGFITIGVDPTADGVGNDVM